MADYTSQFDILMGIMNAYINDPANWSDGIPKLTDFTIGTPLYTLLGSVALAIDTNGFAIWQARQAAYISTATGIDLDNKAADFGVTRKLAVASQKPFNLTKITPAVSAVPIPKGSLITTYPDSLGNVIIFTTDIDSQLPAGQTSVSISTTCQTSGTVGNIQANTPLLIGSALPGIDGVNLSIDIINGVDIESDDQLRARTQAAFASLANGTLAWYKNVALGVEGVQSATVVPQNRGKGTVDVFIVGPNNTIPSPTLQAAVQSAIDAGRPITDDGKQQTPTNLTIDAVIQIHLLPSYDSTATINAVKLAITNYINNLGVGAGILGYVYASQLVAVATSILGVANATTIFIDISVSAYQLPQAGAIIVTTI